jgi:ribosome-associated protein
MIRKGKKELEAVCQKIYDKKGFNILALDVRGVSSMCDFFVIAEGNVERHVCALCQSVVELLKEEGQKPLHLEGDHTGDWAVLDYGNIIIHLFTPEMREKYRLEQVWKEGKVVDINFHI